MTIVSLECNEKIIRMFFFLEEKNVETLVAVSCIRSTNCKPERCVNLNFCQVPVTHPGNSCKT